MWIYLLPSIKSISIFCLYFSILDDLILSKSLIVESIWFGWKKEEPTLRTVHENTEQNIGNKYYSNNGDDNFEHLMGKYKRVS